MECVEKMVTKYIKKVAYGVRADYFNKLAKRYRLEECIDTIPELEELSISQSAAECGHCGRCPNYSLCVAIDELTEKQRFIVTEIYTDRLVEHEVATLLGVTQQAVHINKKKALMKLRGILPEPRRENRQ